MDLRRWGWDEDWEATWTNRAYPENVVPARVLQEHRDRWVVASGADEQAATCQSIDVRPAVGDWVAVRAGGPRGSVQVVDRLPRRTKFTRGAAGRESREQVVAANVDTLWIVHGVDTPLNPRRLERYITLGWESGAGPVIVLTKADLAEDIVELQQTAASVATGVPVRAVSTMDRETLAALAPDLEVGSTVALLGPSGAGKSTLVNALLDRDVLPTGAVRSGDQKGRHTTTWRQLVRLAFSILALALPLSVSAQPAPILDMHLHALGANDQGPAPVAVCAPFPSFPAWDQRQAYVDEFITMLKKPTCDEPIWSPASDEELLEETIETVERLNVYGVLSGPTGRVQEWQAAAPGRFMAGLGFFVGPSAPSPDSIRALVENGSLEVLAEVTNQYFGVAPADEEMAPYWALAEELDLPVGVHMGPGPPGGIYIGQTGYRARLSSALLLEDVLVRHPRLRVYVMHAGYPLLDDMLAVLYAHPQVYVEVGVVVFSRPREDFYRYLRAMVEAGFEDRIMFGSDQMVWPGAIEHAVRVIEAAPFLTDRQKRAILYDNATRFLRLSDEEIDRHWGRHE